MLLLTILETQLQSLIQRELCQAVCYPEGQGAIYPHPLQLVFQYVGLGCIKCTRKLKEKDTQITSRLLQIGIDEVLCVENRIFHSNVHLVEKLE